MRLHRKTDYGGARGAEAGDGCVAKSLRESSNRDEVHMFVVLGDTTGTGCMTTTTDAASGGGSVKK
jgi:hypothetical protein